MQNAGRALLVAGVTAAVVLVLLVLGVWSILW